MGYMILIMIILFLLTILFAYLLYKSAEKNKKLAKENKSLKNMSNMVAEVENEKTGIREEHNEIETNINNSTQSVILPNNEKPKHNHAFGGSCGKNCPAYSE